MSSTETWVVTRPNNPETSYWAGGHNWYTDPAQAETFNSKQSAKDAYRDIHGKFPRTLTVEQLPETTTDVAVYEDATIYDAEVVTDDDLTALASDANRHYAAFEAAGHNALVAAWNCGAALNRAKQLVDHGQWKDWIEHNFDGSYRLAATYMQIATNVQTSALSEFDSISGVLKAIAAGKAKPAKAARSMVARADAILKAAEKLAQVVNQLTDDFDDLEAIESQMNQAGDLVGAAFRRFDAEAYGADQ